MKIDLDDLERKAKAATQDQWQRTPSEQRNGGGTGCISTLTDLDEDGEFREIVAGCGCCDSPDATTEDAEHIAANGPPITLALIARIRELEATLESVTDDRDRIVGVLGAVTVGDILDRGAVLP
jgi:hypothetical protein